MLELNSHENSRYSFSMSFLDRLDIECWILVLLRCFLSFLVQLDIPCWILDISLQD